jgi:predicted DsbA family dithiol-disulfide isomerase
MPGVPFTGTYREEGWRRCGAMSAADGIRFNPWPHGDLPGWSLPALEAAQCVKKQSEELFETLHLRLYEAFFTENRDIADPAVVRDIAAAAGADMARFTADVEAGLGREAVLADSEAAAAEHGVTAIPTVVVAETGRSLVGLADLAAYRAAVEEALA